MHNLGTKSYLKNLKNAIIYSLVLTTCVHFFWNVPKRNKYAAFYSTYDPAVVFKNMQNGGYLQSCPKVEEQKKK